jgi:hypothetical protein
MEVSSLRDRRLVAIFATMIIVGAGAAAAVVELDGTVGYRHLPFTEGALAPHDAEPVLPADPPPVVVVVSEDPPPTPPPPAVAPRPKPTAAPDPAPSLPPTTAPIAGPTPTPVVKVDTAKPRPASASNGAGGDLVIASVTDTVADDPERPKPRERDVDEAKPRHDTSDDVTPGPHDTTTPPPTTTPPTTTPPTLPTLPTPTLPTPTLPTPTLVRPRAEPARVTDAPKPEPTTKVVGNRKGGR